MGHPKTISERRHHTDRVIDKRVKVVRIWNWDMNKFLGTHRIILEPHRAHKFNLNCGCRQCHDYKYQGNSKKRLTHREKKQVISIREQLMPI